ncbi:hypothetical protein Tco_1429724 [Tanacetum coccineum]
MCLDLSTHHYQTTCLVPEHPHSPDYVPGLEYLEYFAPSDAEAPIEDQPLPLDASPTALSPGYIADSDPEEDPEEDPDEDPVDYPTDVGDEEEESSGDDVDDEDEEEASEDDDEEEASENDDEAAMIRSSAALLLPLPEPSLPLLLPATDSRDDVPEADVPPQKRLCLTSPTPRFEVWESSTAAAARQLGLDVTNATDYGFVDAMDATLGRLMSREVGYGITDVWDDMVGDMEERASTTLEAVNQRVADLATTLAQDTHEFYVRFEDA